MEKGIKRLSLYIFTFLISVIYLFIRYLFLDSPNDIHKEILVPIAVTTASSAIVGTFEFFSSYKEKVFTALKCLYIIPNKKVYVSISYLLRIKLTGSEKYLLVKGSKIEQYQPVGGVYKEVGDFSIEKKWNAERVADKENPKDLRFFTKAKFIPSILKWFESGMGREVGVWREFQEELIETNIIEFNNFKIINAEKIGTKYKLLNKERRFNDESYHTIIYDIFSVELNTSQEKELNKLLENSHFTEKYAFVSRDQIEKECFNNSKLKIGEHTKNLI